MEKYIIALEMIFLISGIYISLIWDAEGIKNKGTLWGISRGIAKTAMFRMKETSISTSYNYNILERVTAVFIKEKYEMEVWSSCVTLKNLSIVQGEIPLSADFMLEQLMNNSVLLRPVYAEILLSYRNGHREEAMSIFAQRVPTKAGKIFSGVLNKLEQINPSELLEQMRVLQETLATQRTTVAMKRAEKNSIIVTMFATATIFCLLLNFAIVVVFMDTMAVLGQLF